MEARTCNRTPSARRRRASWWWAWPAASAASCRSPTPSATCIDVLGQIDLRYWQLASSEPMPEEFDVAVIEGAVDHRGHPRPRCAGLRETRGVRDRHGSVRRNGGHSRHGAQAILEASAAGRIRAMRPDGVRRPWWCRARWAASSMSTSRCAAARSTPSISCDVLQRALYGSNNARPPRARCAASASATRSGCFFDAGRSCAWAW